MRSPHLCGGGTGLGTRERNAVVTGTVGCVGLLDEGRGKRGREREKGEEKEKEYEYKGESRCARDPSTAVPSFAKKHPLPKFTALLHPELISGSLPLHLSLYPPYLFPHPYFKGCSRFLSSPIASYLRPRRVACRRCSAGRRGVGQSGEYPADPVGARAMCVCA